MVDPLTYWHSKRIPVLVHSTDQSKLHPCAREAQWLGFDTDTKAHRVYWPGPGNVTIKWNIYFKMTASLEGEDEEALAANSKQAVALGTPTSPPMTNQPDLSKMPPLTPVYDNDDDGDGEPDPDPDPEPKMKQVQPEPQPTQLHQSMCNRRPLRAIWDLQSKEGITLARKGSPRVMISLQKPDPISEESKEAGGVWVIIDGTPELLEDFEGLEHILLAETTDAEVLEPRMLTEAKRRPDWHHWEKAILEELATLEAAGTWVLEEPPPGVNIIGFKWVFKAKKDAMGIIARFKARLVAQGFSQIGGVDYDDMYAPVAQLASSRAIIAMSNRLGLELHQVDIKGAYLNGELNKNEVLYMQFPPSYKPRDTGMRVLRRARGH